MDMLISIHPAYVEKIIAGEKKYEFRKKIPRQKIDRVFVYATNPQRKIVGYFLWNGYMEGCPLDVWARSQEFGGITESEYWKYFLGHNWAYAIVIKKIHLFKEYINPWIYDSFYPPQSYLYLREGRGLYEQLCHLV